MNYIEDTEGEHTEAGAAAKLALRTLAQIPGVDPLEHGIATVNGTLLDFRSYVPPTTQRAERRAQTTDAFIRLTQYLRDDTSVAFEDILGRRFQTIVDFGTQAGPSRDEHRIYFEPIKTPDWLDWAQMHGSWRDQNDVAEFIEEHLDTIIDPPGADLLELLQDIRGHKNVEFQQASRLSDGQTQLKYIEKLTTTGGGKSGLTTIPAKLGVRMPIFRGEAPQSFQVFLRYRIGGSGELALQLRVDRSDDLIDRAIEAIRKTITDAFEADGLPLYQGWHL